jgi:hypothetical protein
MTEPSRRSQPVDVDGTHVQFNDEHDVHMSLRPSMISRRVMTIVE